MYIHVYFPLSHTVYYFPKKYFKKYLHFQNPSSIISACDGLSPNGKALDSDSSIFQVRILVAQFIRRSRFDRLFIFCFGMRAPFILRIIYATESSADALPLGSIHNGTKFAAAKLLPLIKYRCISTVCLRIRVYMQCK